jgi:uncharacterized damage-inducible protein DinB
MPEKDIYLDNRVRGFQITQRVLRAFPPGSLEFKPQEIFRSARGLVMAFIGDEFINKGIVGDRMGQPDASFKTIGGIPEMVAMYESLFNEVTEQIKGLPDEAFNQKVDFFGRPFRRGDAFWIILHDTIHHCGQFSVYIRMAGGKVPSIYGPSHDEPMT